ncbi:MAG: hypothetical protein GY930_16345 [bacterium]|nr:hypothetical protein [bacterium]
MNNPDDTEIPIDAELRGICTEILAEGKSVAEWADVESDDLFQTDSFCGGFDATEMKFCFSWYAPGGGVVGFQFPLAQVEAIAEGRPCKLLGCMQSNSD